MKKYLHKLILFFVIIIAGNSAYSQVSLSSEAGLMFGVTSFQTDFGLRHDFDSENAATMGFGVMHYLKFFGNKYSWRSGSTFWSEHFMLKTEFVYLKNTNIKHEKEAFANIPELKEKWDAMRGNIKMYNIGTQLEYYFFNMENYSTASKQRALNPYISAGVHFSFYDTQVTSKLDVAGTPPDWRNYVVYDNPGNGMYDKWYLKDIPKDDPNSYDGLDHKQTIFNGKGNTFGVSAGLGLRYAVSDSFNLILDSRFQYFFSDRVDGLDASKDPGNKNNDTMIYVNMGIVYVFGQNY
jgi:opacity protein-like surface antigen